MAHYYSRLLVLFTSVLLTNLVLVPNLCAALHNPLTRPVACMTA